MNEYETENEKLLVICFDKMFSLFFSELSNAEDLQNMVPKSHVVKGFNVISAYALENNLQGGKKVRPYALAFPHCATGHFLGESKRVR